MLKSYVIDVLSKCGYSDLVCDGIVHRMFRDGSCACFDCSDGESVPFVLLDGVRGRICSIVDLKRNLSRVHRFKGEIAYYDGGSFLGRCFIDSTDGLVYLINRLDCSYKVVPFSEMEELRKDYMHVNVIKRPFCVLAFQQHVGSTSFDLDCVRVSRSDFDSFMSSFSEVR